MPGTSPGELVPRVEVMEPFGRCFTISTRQTETLLHAWFDEVLPFCWVAGRPGIDDFEQIWPWITVWPMEAWKHTGRPPWGYDWLTDSRVLGQRYEFAARNGDEGLAELAKLRRRLEAELKE